MLDLFTIFSKGGIVLWCFQGTNQALTSSVNALIKSVILQERGGASSFQHGNLTLKHKLDNEFELVFVVAYQKILQLSYIDKFLNAIQLEFRNKYKDDLQQGKISRSFEFDEQFKNILKITEDAARAEAKAPSAMRSFDMSDKSKKKVSSMMENKYTESANKSKKSQKQAKKEAAKKELETSQVSPSKSEATVTNGMYSDEELRKNREKFMLKMKGGKSKQPESKSPEATKKKGKQGRVWDLGGKPADAKSLDYSGSNGEFVEPEISNEVIAEERSNLLGTMKGNLKDIEEEYTNWESEETVNTNTNKSDSKSGWFSSLKGLVGAKTLTEEDISPIMEKMKEELITKNVAADIADKLCQSVSTKLKGRVLGTFNTVSSTVKTALYESCMQILIPKRRVNILRDAMTARDAKRPYVITFCGVNGVGKSTNLAKVCFWLIENGFRVLIAACDTFRAGAVEQLRTHRHKLNALHPADQHNGQSMVELYEKGYGKDAAGIAMEAINFARDKRIDVVLVDTAGRMQDNEPLMRALSKLIKVNQPDLVLFVGEALVGNEAVDQLTKFNQALADHSNMENPRLIDGIVLTKFDTIDDKVGAAISMTYTTGQPIVFVGTGQTYTDLKNLNAKAVVNALLK